LGTPLGKILRIDPFGNNSANGKYGIPANNPFVNDGDSKTLGEIWAYGLRNPHRFSWDTGGDGKMLIVDTGQAFIEEKQYNKKRPKSVLIKQGIQMPPQLTSALRVVLGND
jgi:glucose/arabinose dehydrogenase